MDERHGRGDWLVFALQTALSNWDLPSVLFCFWFFLFRESFVLHYYCYYLHEKAWEKSRLSWKKPQLSWLEQYTTSNTIYLHKHAGIQTHKYEHDLWLPYTCHIFLNSSLINSHFSSPNPRLFNPHIPHQFKYTLPLQNSLNLFIIISPSSF